ncbi:MAG: hypothetical protein HY432_02865 [Candidatus Liptonbacteria bacterium]|nr:hypothetical protein [Candidatus Liptonbacteria bacterium]
MVFSIAALTVLIADSIVLVPAYHFGVLERFRKRTGHIYDEGIGFKLPFVDKVIPILMGLTAIPLVVKFTTEDKLQLQVTGSLQYRPDPRRTDSEGRNLFISMTEAIIQSGIQDMLRDMLGGLGGVYNAEHFIGNRQALGDLINNILKFREPYHLRHTPGTGEGKCGVDGCKFGDRIDAKDLIAFYNSHWKAIKQRNEEERTRGGEASTVEQRYGIDVEVFVLANVDFSDDIKDSFEKEKEAEARARAFRTKLEMAGKAQTLLQIDGQTALNAADVSLNPKIAENKVVVSVEGQAGVLGGILGLLKK